MSAAQPTVTGRRAYSIRDFGATYGVGKTLTFEEIAAGRLKAVKAGAKTLIPADAADAWFASLPPARANNLKGGNPA